MAPPLTIESDIVTSLIANVADLTSSPRNCFAGTVKQPDSASSMPHLAVFVMSRGGRKPQAFFSANPNPVRYPLVDVVVRSNPGQHDAGRTLASKVWDALNEASISGYLRIHCISSFPEGPTFDESDHSYWHIVAEVWFQ